MAGTPTPGSRKPDPDAIIQATGRLTGLVAQQMPRNIAPGRAHWDYYGPAMISRMLDLVESVQALMQADRAVDGAVLVRVLYEHVVKFCWISIDPTTNYDRWRDDARRWDTKLMNDAIGLGVAPGVVADANQFNQLPDTAQQADQIERHWGAKIAEFPSPTTGPQVLVTFRGMYLPVYRSGSEPVHARPEILDAYNDRGSDLWQMGPGAGSKTLFWPLIVPLFAWALLVCNDQWDWPDRGEVMAANNGMYAD